MKNATAVANEEAMILGRLIKSQKKLSRAAAQALLRLSFDEEDHSRMHELAKKNQADQLTPKEELELLGYLKVGLFLDLIHAKAAQSLRPVSRRA